MLKKMLHMENFLLIQDSLAIPLVGMGEKMKLKEIVDDCQISNAQVRRGYRR